MPTAVLLMRASVQVATQLERVLAAPDAYATHARSANCAARSATCSSISSRTGFPSRRTASRTSRADIVRRVHDVIGHPEAPVDVLSPGRIARERRTMQNSFQSVVQTSLLNYVRSLRLSQVRRMLPIRGRPTCRSATRPRAGLQRISGISRVRKAQFGELPSTTARRAVRDAKTRCFRAKPAIISC